MFFFLLLYLVDMDIKNDFNPIFGVSIIFKTKGNSLFESPLIIFTSPLVLLGHQGQSV
jgi:hypothetical protein